VYLDVDCSRLTYTSPVSPGVSLAVQRWEERKRGYTTREERIQKLVLHTGLDEWVVTFMHGDKLCTHWAPRSSWLKEHCQHGTSTWTNPLSRPDPVFHPDRAETAEEALEQSLLSVVSPNMTGAGMKLELEELFCRDVEAFSEVFEVSSGGTSSRCRRGLGGLRVSELASVPRNPNFSTKCASETRKLKFRDKCLRGTCT